MLIMVFGKERILLELSRALGLAFMESGVGFAEAGDKSDKTRNLFTSESTICEYVTYKIHWSKLLFRHCQSCLAKRVTFHQAPTGT
jgi:hypothetical protein